MSAQAGSSALFGRLAVSPARRRRDRVARSAVLGATLLALVPLVLIVYYLLKKGFGTIEMVALASAISIPIGIGVALWLVEYGRNSRFAQAVRFFVDVLTGVPSIVFGLFVYIVLVVGTHSTYAGYKGSIALSLLMLPVIIRSAEVILMLVPAGLRESALALGAPRWRVIAKVVLPTALPGMVTGVLLAVARAAGETAPLLFTAASTHKTTTDLGAFMNSLPVQIYSDVTSPTASVVDRAWGAALTLVVLILLLNLIARLISRRSRLA
jgi:phosphate transport system permease protein